MHVHESGLVQTELVQRAVCSVLGVATYKLRIFECPSPSVRVRLRTFV